MPTNLVRLGMSVKVLAEHGEPYAIAGLGLSYNVPEGADMIPVADRLAHRPNGEAKFLESICVWLDIRAPRFWWSQFDTYRVGVTKQSQSTMHTLMKRLLTADDFCGGVTEAAIAEVNAAILQGDIEKAKALLPEGFLQRRIVCTNYGALQRIVRGRRGHRLPQWQEFCVSVLAQVKRPQWISEQPSTEGGSDEGAA